MKTLRASRRWLSTVGLLAVGVLVFGLAVQGAPTGKAGGEANLKKPVATSGWQPGTSVDQPGVTLDANSPQVGHGRLVVLPPVLVDQTKNVLMAEQRGRFLAVGPWPTGDHAKGITLTCTSDESCSDCEACTQDQCDAGACTNPPQELGTTFAGCSDGYWCTGAEECDGAGVCVPAATPPCPPTGQPTLTACNEMNNECVAPECTTDVECDDADACTEDTCVLENGVNGLCDHRNICINGRCCNNTTGACSMATEKDCPGGAYLFTNGACSTVQPSGNMNDCPEYAAGIAPQGEYVGETGVISNLSCDSLTEYRDEYQLKGYPGQPYLAIEFLRFAGRVVSEYDARWDITFYDENGLYIENVFWPDGQDDGWDIDYQIKTADFDPPVVIPAKGKIGWSVQNNFSPGGRVQLRFTDAVDVGTNWGVDEKVAFEIVGSYTSAPIGGCCLPDGSCANLLAWECEAGSGGIFQGVGTTCGICVGGDNEGDSCDDAGDCPGGACEDQVCNNAPETQCTDDGDCPPGGTCVNLATACLTQACCQDNSTVAACQEIVGAGKTCATELGPDWSTQGFGSRCEPNCCPRNAVTGGNDCWSAVAQNLTIPAVGSDPVSVTITGNNSGATEDDYARCNIWEGTDPPEYGWWECIDVQGVAGSDCFNLRVDLCCTDIAGDPLRPAWGNMVQGCDPCETLLQNAGVDPPIGIGRGTSGFARGEPYCSEDNLWQTYGPLRAGKYCYPIYTVADGTSGVPPGADYQLHFTIAACATAACCVGSSCDEKNELDCAAAGGYWMAPPYKEGPTVTCDDTPETGTCATGACCVGPGQCQDKVDTQDMTEADCALLEGDYLGGARCADPTPPCPACEIMTDANCSDHNDTWYLWQGYDPSDGTTWRRYDDFVALSDVALETVCLVGAWIGYDGSWHDCACLDHSDEPDCPRDANDQWMVSVYTNNAGLPGTLVGASAVTNWAREVETPPATPGDPTWDPYIVSLTLDDPIALDGGVTYFLSVFNDTSDHEGAVPCWWYWSGSPYDGNSWHVLDANGVFEPIDWYPYPDPPNGPFDMNWCVNFPWGVPANVTGSCCQCGTGCTDGQTWLQCDTLGGNWKLNQTCGAITCPTTPAANDNCATPTVVGNGTHSYNTMCTTHAGPDRIDCDGNGSADTTVGRDVWFEYHTGECEGNLTVSMCDTQNYDAVLSLYSNGTNACTCPTDGTTLLACSDDGCDESAGVGEITEYVYPNRCILIRVGGFAPDYDPDDPDNTGPDAADMGFGTLGVSCVGGCRVADAPALEPSVPDPGFGSRVRYLGFTAGTAGRNEAIRVKFTDLPVPFEYAEGREMWVGQPTDVSEVAGKTDATPPTFKLAELQCDPFYTDWTQYPAVLVRSSNLVPRGIYTMQAIDQQNCSTANEADYSAPLAVKLSKWGDAVGASNADSPQGTVNFGDISSVVDKFKNLAIAPTKSRVDVSPSLPDRIVDFQDIPSIVDAFRGLAYPYSGPPAIDPCP